MKRESRLGNSGLNSDPPANRSGVRTSPHSVPVRSSIIISRSPIRTDKPCDIHVVSRRVIAFVCVHFRSLELTSHAEAHILTNHREFHYKYSLNHALRENRC